MQYFLPSGHGLVLKPALASSSGASIGGCVCGRISEKTMR